MKEWNEHDKKKKKKSRKKFCHKGVLMARNDSGGVAGFAPISAKGCKKEYHQPCLWKYTSTFFFSVNMY